MKQLIVAIAMTTVAFTAAAHSTQAGDTIAIAHVCDPQIGFGPDGLVADLKAFELEIEHINAAGVDAVAIAGDMVNRMDSASTALFLEAMRKIDAPVILTPGNHDIAEPVTTEGLALYRSVFGPDRSTLDVKKLRIIAYNSQLMRQGPVDEMQAQEKWLDEELARAAADGLQPVIVCHVPPFVASVDEDDAYFNMPLEMRAMLLKRFADAGVRLWLCGHTHKTHRNDANGIAILNGENTSCNFDKRPKGFRLLRIAPDGSFTWDFVAN